MFVLTPVQEAKTDVPEVLTANHHPLPVSGLTTAQFNASPLLHPALISTASAAAATPSPGRMRKELDDSGHFVDASSVHTVSSDEFFDADVHVDPKHHTRGAEGDWREGEEGEVVEDSEFAEDDLGMCVCM